MSTPWYSDGLSFACTQCGNCCTGKPGFVWVTTAEIEAIAEFRGESYDEVYGLSTRREGIRRSLKEKSNFDCVYFEAGVGCTIYPVRPKQCRTWPFWESNLHSPADWNRTAEGCPGCNQGDLIPVEEITRRMKVVRL